MRPSGSTHLPPRETSNQTVVTSVLPEAVKETPPRERDAAGEAPSPVPVEPASTLSPSCEAAEKPVPKLNFDLILSDLFRVAHGESKESLRRPSEWIETGLGLDLCAKILADLEADASEDSKEVLRKRELMRKIHARRKEAEQRAERNEEMSH
jgi:hypothetical protein